MYAQLNEMNLIGGEDPIGQPDDHGNRAEVACSQVICGRSRGAERDRAGELGVHARVAPKLFQSRLEEKRNRRGSAQQQKSIRVSPEYQNCQGGQSDGGIKENEGINEPPLTVVLRAQRRQSESGFHWSAQAE